MEPVKEKFIKVDKIIELSGEIPSLEVIKRMYNNRFKGITCQKRKETLPQMSQHRDYGEVLKDNFL